jgi:6-phosphofructokinase 1
MSHDPLPKLITTAQLGTPNFLSPLARYNSGKKGHSRFVSEQQFIRHDLNYFEGQTPSEPELFFEKAGARERLFFDPSKTRIAIVTCGGLCPGLNNVIRSVFVESHFNYGVDEVWGIQYGYQGLNPEIGLPPVLLTTDRIENIHEEGGTMLGSSRGQQDPKVIVDFLVEKKINILFCVGGDGTQRGAMTIYDEVSRRSLPISVVGIPKTIDNDIAYCQKTFGFMTAVQKAEVVLRGAHVEALGARGGVGLVKVMGRDAGFIAAMAALASQEVNFALIPEVPFALEGENGFLPHLEQRLDKRRHALVVVSEGAGQHLFGNDTNECDASGNHMHRDIGTFLKRKIVDYFQSKSKPITVKYIDPSYYIRSAAANCEDRVLCDQFARRAVHAAMSGKTGLVICNWNSRFIHVPMGMVTSEKKQLRTDGELWSLVKESTGQKF